MVKKKKKKGRRSDAEVGRGLQEQKKADHRNEATVIGEDGVGVKPKAGLWLVNHARRRVYGQIVEVRRTGEVVWQSLAMNKRVPTSAKTIVENGYSYTATRPAGYSTPG